MAAFNWMKRLCAIDPGRAINRVTIPGTHDSGTKTATYPASSQCQDTTIQEQLMMGIRYLDIRVDSSTSDLRVVHGSYPTFGNSDIYFGDVANDCRDFVIGANGTGTNEETVFLQVKSDRGSEDDANMHDKVLSILKDAFVGRESSLTLNTLPWGFAAQSPTLTSLKGQLVLLRRYKVSNGGANETGTAVHSFASDSDFQGWRASPGGRQWVDVYEAGKFEWPDGQTNTSHFGKLEAYRNRVGMGFVIQDNYSLGAEEKWNAVQTFLDLCKDGQLPFAWYLNFASTAGPKASSDEINPKLKSYFSSLSNCGAGTVLMDFATADLVTAVYGANF